jgi:molecular chaperone DnaJ
MAPENKDFYQILGLNSSASADEVRRAYRILARRYHPDLNPGTSEERFKAVAEAYAVLSDPDRRSSYDREYERLRSTQGFSSSSGGSSNGPRSRARSAYSRAAQTSAQERSQTGPFGQAASRPRGARNRFFQEHSAPNGSQQNAGRRATAAPGSSSPQAAHTAAHTAAELGAGLAESAKALWRRVSQKRTAGQAPSSTTSPILHRPQRISIIEMSVSMHDAILGARRTVEVGEPNGLRKIAVSIPAGVRTGSILRMRSKDDPSEELVLILRVASHPFLSIHVRGLVAEIPVSVSEALQGAQIRVPTLEEPVLIRIAPGSQSGSEVRISGQGIMQRDGSRGDLFVRLMIRVPESPDAVGLKEVASAFEQYYAHGPRQQLVNNLLES